VDEHNSLCDARAMKDMKISNIINALNDIYDTSDYFSYPVILQGDNQFNNREFKEWLDERNIYLKITEPHNSRQNASVERLNQILGFNLWLIMTDKEITTKKPNSEWRKYYKNIIKLINEKYLPNLDKNLNKPLTKSTTIKNANNPVFEIGDIVRLALKQPQNLQGIKYKNDKWRKTDHHFSYPDTYIIHQVLLMPSNPVLYSLKENKKDGRILKGFYTYERLKLVKN
jgi:hypothetical protein